MVDTQNIMLDPPCNTMDVIERGTRPKTMIQFSASRTPQSNVVNQWQGCSVLGGAGICVTSSIIFRVTKRSP